MNKIFKVIWSKSKQCYVVVSEMAKNKTGKKKIVVASILAALAIQTAGVIDVAAAPTDQPSAAIANGTVTSGKTNGLAIGNLASSSSNQSIAIGYLSSASATEADPALPATAVGAGANATGQSTVALGLSAQAKSGRATALGAKSVASEDAAVAVGYGTQATGNYATALGVDANASNNDSTAFGHGATSSGASSTALGSRAKAGGTAGVGIGMMANATNQYGVAIGGESSSTADNSIAIGKKSSATHENGIAIGAYTSSKGANGVAIGTNGTKTDLGGVAVGQAAAANKFNSVAVGMNVTADGDNSVALGGNATASSDGTIAIGSYGSTKTTATGNRALAIGSATTANGLESIAIGSRVNSTSQHSIAIGTASNASAVRSIAIGADSSATVDGGVALGRDSVANVPGGSTNKGYDPNVNRTNRYSGLTSNVLTSTTGAVAIGNGSTVTRQLTGLAAGTRDTDAVNVAQLKSVNLAYTGNVGSGDVNLANGTLGLKGDGTYITTSASGQNLTISGKIQNINVTNGQASASAAGMADARNVADSINRAISANAYSWKLAAANDSNGTVDINKNDTVIFNGDNNISVTRNGKQINSALNKNLTVESVNASKKITVASGGTGIVLDGSTGAVSGKTFTGQSFTAGDNVLSNTTLQIGSPTGSNNVTITRDGLTAKAGTKIVKFGTNGIDAGGQQITNVSSGGNIGTNAANITDIKNAVSGVTLKLDTNSKTGTVKLSESPLKVIGANGIRTDLLGTNNGSLVVGLDSNTVNATTKGIGLTGDTGATGLKYLKDGDATFKVAGDANLVTTKASATGVQVSVDVTKVKNLAVGAVTVSKANTADNPITVTPTTGTNSKDYAIGIDTTKLANQTQLTYKANGANANKVSLANGLNFTNGTFTTATVGTNGNVTISTATETITNDADGKAKVVSPTDGLATAKNVADAINEAADKAKAGAAWNLTTNSSTTDKTSVQGGDTVDLINGDNIVITQDGTDKKKITVATKKDLTVDSVTAGNTVINTSGLTNGTTTITGSGITTDKVTVGGISLDKTDGINAGGKAISNVASGGTTDTNAANIGDVKQAVANLSQNLNITDGTNNGTVDLKNQKLNVAGANGVTATVNNQTITVGLDTDTKTKVDNSSTAVARSISLGADSGTVSSQSLKDGDVAFNVKGATGDFVSTKMNGDTVEVSTKRATIDSNATTGAASVTGDDGLATAKNVADAINKAANTARAGAAWNLTTNSSTTDKTSVQGGDTVDLINGDNIVITQDGTDKKKITVATKKDLTVDSVTAGNTVINTSGLTNGTTTITGSGITTDKVTVGGISLDKTDGINAGGKAISNVASGGTTDTNAANIGDVKQAVANLSQNLNITDGTNNGTVDLKNQKLNVAGANGVTATVNNQTITVGLDTDTKTKVDNSSTAVARSISLGADSGTPSSQSLKDGDVAFNVKGATSDFVSTKINGDTVEVSTKRATINSDANTGVASVTGDDGLATAKNVADAINKAAKASSDAVNLKFSGDTNTSTGVVNLKDDTFGIKGDGKYVTTDADGKNLTVKVSEAEVKKSAVGAVTVSTDATDANNPLTVTPTTSADGTTKDYKITIDGTKIAAKTNLSYKANDGTAKLVSLADGLNFKNGTLTTATIDNAGVVKYDVNTATITAGADGTITGPATDGVATAKNVADAINAAKKATKTEITANDGEAADGTTGNVVLTSSKAADGHTIYDVKLNDKVTLGTGANAVTIDGTTGTITSKNANIGGVTVDGTNKYVTGLGNTTWNGNAVSGRAATEDQLKAVADAAASQTWQITADKDATTSGIQTGTKKDAKVGKDAKVKMIAGENITINQNELDFTYSLNKDLVNMNSASFNGTGGNTTVINGDSITQTAGTQTNTSTAAGNTVADGAKSTATTAAGTTITDGAKTNTSTADSTVINDGNGNNTALTKDGVTITTAGKDKVSLTGDGLDNGNNKIANVADGTNDTDAVNVRQLEAKTKASTTELTANGGESAGSTTGNIVLTKRTAADGHIIYDNKLNDKVTLGAADPTKAITVDGTNGTIKAGKDGNAVAINGTDGTIKAGDGTNAVAIDGVNGSVKVADTIALNGKDGKAAIGTVGIDGKDGIITTGGNNPVAVNGKDGVVTGLTNKTWNPNNITSGRAATEDQVQSAVANAGWDATVGTEGSGVNSTPSATPEKIRPNETLTFKAGNNMMVSQNGKSISYAVNPELTDMKSATFKDAAGNTTVTNGNGITITPGSTNPNNPNAGPVSLTKDGLNNGNNQIKGVAPGSDDTDAVNIGQLKASNAKIGDAIGQVAGEVQRVGAHAAAMAALKPIQYDPLEPTQVMAGVGNYRGETAAALGLAHYTNENTMFNIGVSVGGNHNMVNAGVTHKFGYSPEKKNIPDRYKAGPISSVYVMQDEVSSLKKENAEQKYVIADQAARLNTLEAENERQRQELAETKQGLDDLRAAVDRLLASKG